MGNVNKKIESNIDLKKRKVNTINSLLEVEHFLCNFNNIVKGFKIYNLLKK